MSGRPADPGVISERPQTIDLWLGICMPLAIVLGAYVGVLLAGTGNHGIADSVILLLRDLPGLGWLAAGFEWLTDALDAIVPGGFQRALEDFVVSVLLTALIGLTSFGAYRLWLLVLRLLGRSPPSPKALQPPFGRGSAAYQASFWLMIVITVMIGVILPLSVLALDWLGFQDQQKAIAGFFPFGLLLGAIYLVQHASPQARSRDGQTAGSPDGTDPAAPDVEAFARRLAAAYPDQLLADQALSPPPPQQHGKVVEADGPTAAHFERLEAAGRIDAPDRAALAALVAAFTAEKDQRNILFTEPLSPLHHTFIAEAIHLAEDSGGGAIIICPEATRETVEADVKEALNAHCLPITQHLWPDERTKTSRKDERVISTVVFASEKTLVETVFGSEVQAFRHEAERLRLVVLIDLDQFDVAQLRLGLAFLRASAPAGAVRGIVHSAQQHGVENLVRNLFGLRTAPFSNRSLGRASGPMRALVWRNSAAWRDELIDAVIPPAAARGAAPIRRPAAAGACEPLPLLGLKAAQSGIGPALVDIGSAENRARWEQACYTRASPSADVPKAGDLPDMFQHRRASVPSGSPDLALLIQDRQNLATALSQLKLSRTRQTRVALIASEPYALRDAIVDSVRVDGWFDDRFSPMALRPIEGLRELAWNIVVHLMSPQAGVARSRVKEYFQQFQTGADGRSQDASARPRLLTRHTLSPTRLGVQRLLELEFSGRFPIVARRRSIDGKRHPTLAEDPAIEDDEWFSCDNMPALREALFADIPIRQAGATGSSPSRGSCAPDGVTRLPRDDHGLAYAAGSVLRGEDGGRLVKRVGRDGIFTEAESGAGALEPTRNEIFCRAYALDLADPTTIEDQPQDLRTMPSIEVETLTLYTPVRRCTYARILESSLQSEKQAPSGPLDLGRSEAAVQQHKAAMVQAIRITVYPGFDAVTDTSKTAFVLAVCLSDLIAALFPAMAHRTAVLSPQAEPAVRRLMASRDSLEAHVRARYPRLVAEADPSTGKATPPAAAEEVDAHLKVFYRNNFSHHQAELGETPLAVIDLLVVEDWPSSLGVCGAIRADPDRVFQALGKYLDWLAANADRPDLFHRFSGDRLSDEFDYASAAALLNAINADAADGHHGSR